MVLLDVTPLSLGVETLGGVMTVMIPRNTTIPTQRKEVFSTAADSQPSVEIHVAQGERASVRDNRTLGKFHLEGIMPAPRGVPKIEVAFDIDANGILSVHAKDLATGKDQRITITASGGLKEEDIKRMVREAAEHEEEDRKRREEVESRNRLENLCYTMEKTCEENKDKISETDHTTLKSLIEEGRQAVAKQDAVLVTSALERLEKEAHRISSEMYQQAAPSSPTSAENVPSSNEVIDAEIV
jgi:molecular chaperone DnaK